MNNQKITHKIWTGEKMNELTLINKNKISK